MNSSFKENSERSRVWRCAGSYSRSSSSSERNSRSSEWRRSRTRDADAVVPVRIEPDASGTGEIEARAGDEHHFAHVSSCNSDSASLYGAGSGL